MKNNDLITKMINAENKPAFYLRHYNELVDTSVLLFDEVSSNLHGYDDKNFGNYHLIGLGNYNNSYLLDRNIYLSGNNIKVKGIVYFDVNMLSRLDSYIKGRNVTDAESFLELMNYIKSRRYGIETITAAIERISKGYSEKSFNSSLKSFRKFAKSDKLDSNTFNVTISDDDNKLLKLYKNEVLSYWQNDSLLTQYKALYCMIAKACILKFQNNDRKFDDLVLYCLDTLNIVLVNELYQLGEFFSETKRSISTFQKLQISKGKKIIDTVKNVTWDLYHARLVEQIRPIVIHNDSDTVIELPFFVTNDRGIYDFLHANKLKLIVFKLDTSSSIYEKNFCEIFKLLSNKNIGDKLLNEADLRKKRVKNVNWDNQIHKLNATFSRKINKLL